MPDSAALTLAIAVEDRKLRPNLIDLVRQLPEVGGPYAASATTAVYIGLITQAVDCLLLWEEAPAEDKATYEAPAIEALGYLLEMLESMAMEMRGFVEFYDAPAEVDGVRPEIDTSVATPELGKAIDKLRAAVDNEKRPAKLRDLLEDQLEAEQFVTAAEEIRSESEDLRDKISELESEVAELETEAETIEAKATLVEEIGDKVLAALEAVDYLDEAEGRDEKEEAREGLFEALQAVVDAYDEAEADEAR